MPRKARIDAPGALHHVMARGIERRNIFTDNADCDDFLSRVEHIIEESNTLCYAWSLVQNHFHLLLKTGNIPIATVMRRLLTGYVIRFNHRHSRNGHLFQNRYKSILCQEDVYLKELIRYIHLNPLRAGIVRDLEALDSYPSIDPPGGRPGVHSAGKNRRPRKVTGSRQSPQSHLPLGGIGTRPDNDPFGRHPGDFSADCKRSRQKGGADCF